MAALHGNKEKFEELLKANKQVLVDFFATWCGPCKMLAPTIDELADKYEGKVPVLKIDVDEEQELAMKYGVQSIPTVILFDDGDVAEQLVGVRDEETYTQLLDDHLNA